VPTDYGYLNARVRGLRSKLLEADFYNEALATSDFKSFMAVLAQSPYLREVEEAQSRYSGLKALDSALARNFYQTVRSVANVAQGEPDKLISLLLLRYDLANLKTIARAKHSGRSTEDVAQALLPAGDLKPAVLETLASAPDMAAAAQAVLITPTPLRSAFARAASRYQSDGDLYKLELELDRSYFSTILSTLKRATVPPEFMRHIRREIDATNLRTALKLRGSARANEDLFILGGREITRTFFDALAADGSMQGLAGTNFAAVTETQSLGEAEAVIRGVLDQSAKRGAADPLDIGMFANYLRQKEAETAKLRLLGRGKFYNVPRDRLAKELGHG
jgi:V/A-type H+/Na+-transporting ATPase subunit C